MDSEYTPTTEELRTSLAELTERAEAARNKYANQVSGPAFDRWLAAEKAKWQAEALREAADELGQQGTEPWNRNSVAIFTLQLRAARIEKGSDDDR